MKDAIEVMIRNGIFLNRGTERLFPDELSMGGYLDGTDFQMVARFDGYVEASDQILHLQLPGADTGQYCLRVDVVRAPAPHPDLERQPARLLYLKPANPQDLGKILQYLRFCASRLPQTTL
jgi:hypothetical protein